MRVLQVLTDTERRGAQVFGVDLGKALGTRGWDVRTVALEASTGGARLPVPALGPSRLGPRTLAALRRALAGADVAIAHGSSTLHACALAGSRLTTPFVYRNIGDPLFWAGTAARRLRVRLALRHAAAVAALWPGSAGALQRHLGVPAGRITVIPNGVPAARFPPATRAERDGARRLWALDTQRPVVLSVGALTAEKDLSSLLGALAGLPDVQLLVIGDGPLRATLETQAARMLAGRAVFAGPQASPRPAYAAADALCLSSRSEGMPAVLIEAGLSALPAVATDVGGVAGIVTARTGRLVTAGDTAALARALREVLAAQATLGAAARRYCLEHFEIDVVASAWDVLLRRLVVQDQQRTGRAGADEDHNGPLDASAGWEHRGNVSP